MRNLRWVAVPVSVLGLVFGFFGVMWTGAVQLAVAAALLVLAAAIWRTTAGTWPLATNAR